MITPNDIRARITHVGLNPDEFTCSALRDIVHDIRDEHPDGHPLSHHAFRRIAERNHPHQ